MEAAKGTGHNNYVILLEPLFSERRVRRMLINIKYNNDQYDYVPRRILNELIARKEIKQFYRRSEQRWVRIGVDRMRGMGGAYNSVERRETQAVHAY